MRARSLAVPVGLLAALACAAPPAHAATYSVWSCADAQNKPLSTGDFSPATAGTQAIATSTCGANVTGSTPGNMQAAAGGGPSQPDTGIAAGWSALAAPGTKISGLDVWWTNSASVQIPGRISIIASTGPLYVRDAGAFGNVGLPFEDGNRQTFTGLSADSAAPDRLVPDGLRQTRPRDRRGLQRLPRQADRQRHDGADRRGERHTDAMTLPGPVTLQARAADVGGGVRDLQLLVDGNVVDAKQAGGTCADINPASGDANEYTVMRPCLAQLPAAAEPLATFTLTPAMLATAGAHTVAIVAHDAAGNAGTLLSHTVSVAPALLDGPAPASRYDAARDLFFNPDVDVASAARPNGANAGPATIRLAFVVRRTVRVKGRPRRVTTFTRRRTVSYSTAARCAPA